MFTLASPHYFRYVHAMVFDDGFVDLFIMIATSDRSNAPSVLGSNLAPVMLKITIRTVLLSLVRAEYTSGMWPFLEVFFQWLNQRKETSFEQLTPLGCLRSIRCSLSLKKDVIERLSFANFW